ncbi:hypothetical protein DVH24_002023 [Malus domestica]|uniref:Uncharacterized protein n=1 Tax=Malus domestica TaxID=3750 RepID=A0A498I8X5_MALDO|nr:hypothetical protein DVH24_002023 [Malus domestica]
MQYQQTTQLLQILTQGHQILQQREQVNAQAIANLEKQVDQIAAILGERDQEICPSEPQANPSEQSVQHEEVNATIIVKRNVEIDNQLNEEKKENSMLEDPLHDPSQITTNEKSLSEEIQIVDRVLNFKAFEENPCQPKIFDCCIFESIDSTILDSLILHEFKYHFEVHCSKYGREFGIEAKIEVVHAQRTSLPMAKIWWKRQRKNMKKRKKCQALKLKKKQKYVVPHCLVSTPNFKATRWKKWTKKKTHGVFPHFNDPPSST